MRTNNHRSTYIVPLLFSLVISLAGCAVIMLIPANRGDETWNYDFARCICSGMHPFKDISMVPTPFAAYLMACFLAVFGNSMLTYRIIGCMLFVVTVWLLYRLCEKVSHGNSIIAMICSVFFTASNFLSWVYGYNTLNVTFGLVTLLLEDKILKESNEKKRTCLNMLSGLIIGLMPITKQTVGGIAVILNGVYCLWIFLKEKTERKDMALRVILSGMPTLLYFGYMAVCGDFAYFWDYAVRGLFRFSNRSSFMEFIGTSIGSFLLGVLPIIAFLITLFVLPETQGKDKRQIWFTLLMSLACASVAYPLFDTTHCSVASVLSLVLIAHIIGKMHGESEKKKKIAKIGAVVLMALITVATCRENAWYAKSIIRLGNENVVISDLHHFEGLRQEKAMIDTAKKMQDYIRQKEEENITVIMTDSVSCITMISMDKYNKDFDMFNIGNYGTKTNADLVAQVKKPAEFIVHDNEAQWTGQAPLDFLLYIRENAIKTGEIETYSVYTVEEKEERNEKENQ